MPKIFVCFVVGLVLILSACSSLIPDQAITNPFGLDGKTVTLEQQTTQAGLSAQALSAVYKGSVSSSFADLSLELPGGIAPSGISENVGIKADIKVASSALEAAFPESLSIVASQLAFTVSDGSGTPSVSQTFDSASGLNLTLSKKPGGCGVAGTTTTCTYTTNAVDTVLLVAQLVGGNFSTFFNDILRGGSAPNTLTGNFSLTISGDALFPADSKVTVILHTSKGTLMF
jgi:hypothetical protein